MLLICSTIVNRHTAADLHLHIDILHFNAVKGDCVYPRDQIFALNLKWIRLYGTKNLQNIGLCRVFLFMSTKKLNPLIPSSPSPGKTGDRLGIKKTWGKTMATKTMTGKIGENEMAKLHARFVVPVAVHGMLRGDEPLDDVAEYTLNDIIGGLQPDTALLCLALCAQHVAASLPRLGIARALQIEAGMIVDEYGPVWLANEQGSDLINEKALRTLLTHIPEDLESLSDLFGAVLGELDEENAVAAILCDILGGLAGMHRDYAESELQNIGLSAAASKPKTEPVSHSGSNIIPFRR